MERNRISLFCLLISSLLISCINASELFLANNLNFTYAGGPDTWVLEFQVKTNTDAHVLLAGCEGCNGYEIVIGGWGNTKSVIRAKKQGDAKVSVKVGLEKTN